jgi:hypothetical protein
MITINLFFRSVVTVALWLAAAKRARVFWRPD